MGTPEKEINQVGNAIQSLSYNPGSLREASRTFGGIPVYEAMHDKGLTITRNLRPEQRATLPKDLQMVSVIAFAVDTIPEFGNFSIYEKYLLLLSTYYHINEKLSTSQLAAFFQLPESTTTSLRHYEENADKKIIREHLLSVSAIGLGLLSHGYEIKQLGLYHWFYEKVRNSKNDQLLMPDLAAQVPAELIPDDLRTVTRSKMIRTLGQRMFTMGHNLVDSNLLDEERLARAQLRKQKNEKILAVNLENMRRSGQHKTLEELAQGTTLTAKNTIQSHIHPLRRGKHELFRGKKTGVQESLDAVNAAITALAEGETRKARSKITVKQIIAYLNTQGIFMSESQINGYYKRYRDELNVGLKKPIITPDMEQQIKALHEEGLSTYEIARRLDISPAAVQKRVR